MWELLGAARCGADCVVLLRRRSRKKRTGENTRVNDALNWEQYRRSLIALPPIIHNALRVLMAPEPFTHQGPYYCQCQGGKAHYRAKRAPNTTRLTQNTYNLCIRQMSHSILQLFVQLQV